MGETLCDNCSKMYQQAFESATGRVLRQLIEDGVEFDRRCVKCTKEPSYLGLAYGETCLQKFAPQLYEDMQPKQATEGSSKILQLVKDRNKAAITTTEEARALFDDEDGVRVA